MMQKNTKWLIYRLASAGVTLFGIGYVLIVKLQESGGGWKLFLNYLGYFTLQADIWILLIFIWLIVNRLRGRPDSAMSPFLRGGALLYIIISSLITFVMLNERMELTFIETIVNIVSHIVVALLYGIDCYYSVESQSYRWNYVYLWLIYPFIFFLFTAAESLVSGYYRYYFFNFEQMGTAFYLFEILLFILIFGGGGAILVFFNRNLKQHTRALPQA